MDITAELREAAAGLKPGDCIASAAYSPEGAMNALELMEPKLDPGFHPAPVPVAQRIKNGSLPLLTLTTEQVVAVMDHLIALEVRDWMRYRAYVLLPEMLSPQSLL